MIPLVVVLPIAAMVSCIPLLSSDAPLCLDKKQHLYICIDGECRTPAGLSKSWRGHPDREKRDYEKLYGVK